uniref:Si:ch211-39f2.3 n=1 Tax=Echeneis naucrates TaxID=173247 RepID=A0A665WKG4_ECHNA
MKGDPVQLGDSFWRDSTCAEKCTCTSQGLQCVRQPCSFAQVCRPSSFHHSCQNVPRHSCTISGDPHYRTFDGTLFHFQGTCTYILSEQCRRNLPYYRVEGKNEHRGSTRVSWTRLVKVYVHNETIELVKGRRGEAKVNGNFAATPISLNNGSIQIYESGFSVTISTNFGLVVSYDTNHYVRISLPSTYQNATCGLCGNFNSRGADDFQTPQGEVVSSDVTFANSWKVSGDDDPGCEARCSGLACAGCTDNEAALFGDTGHCGILESPSGPFAACRMRVNPQPFVESCVYDLCVAGGHQPVLCQALNVYATQCQENGVQLPNWRSPGLCEIQCPANSHFESQGSGCPATCVNLNSTQTCPLPAQESCVCNAGYVLSGGVCVPLSECGCSFEGRYYRSGATVIPDEDCGRRCSCSHGSMTCRSHSCGPLESCRVEDGERGCRPNSYGTCWLKGSGSYHMFDGLTYHYPGACRLTLARVMGFSDHPHFLVTAEKVPRGQHDFARLLKFEALGTQVTIDMADNSVVDGQLIRLPFRSASNQIQVYHSSIHSIILQTAFGVSVQTVSPDFVRITAPGIYNGSLGGLCGNFNGDSNDDFRTPNGMLVNSSLAFGDSWREGPINAQCVNPSPTSNYNSSRCDIIASPDSPFTQCWAVVDPQRHVNICREAIRFSGHSASALCEQLQGYALMCQQKGVTLEHWRNVTGCEQTCPLNSHYELCGSTCPFACPSLSAPFSCGTLCQEGCQCDDGFVLSGNQCVLPTSCGCYHEGHYRQAGEQFWDGDECQSFCSCNGTTGAVHCAPSSCGPQESCRVVRGEFGCHPNPHGTCSASGDPHYLTFDQKAYDFQGTCRYVLATLCNDTSGLPNFSVEAKNEPWFGLPVSVTAEVFVNVSDYQFRMTRGRRANVPVVLSRNVSIFASGHQTFIEADFGLRVMYDGSSVVSISVPSHYRGLTCGLCGNFNGNQSDDFTTPSGAIVTAADEFGAAWKVANDDTCSDGCGSSCPRCTNEQPARAQCEVIKAVTGPFRLCHQHVDPTPYFNDCVFDTCLLGNERQEPLCRTIEAYISACHSANVEIFPWRDNTTCRLDCPANSHYELCGTDCGHTCASSIDATCERVCSEGCFCDEGFLRSGTTCVPVESCGCTYEGFYYNVILTDKYTCAEKCTCTSQGLQCVRQPCSFAQVCRPSSFHHSCQNVPRHSCTISGDPHYRTFDGARFSFQGTCTYILSEQCRQDLPYFRVEGKNEHIGSTRVSWTGLVKVYVHNETIELVRGRRGEAKVNGNFAATPISLNNGSIQIYESGFSVTISTNFGLVVSYHTNYYVRISLPSTYQNATCGLCGNFNSRGADDFQTPQGEVVSSDVTFANSWKVSGDDDPGCDAQCSGLACAGCTDNETALFGDTGHCGILQSPSGPFAVCHMQLNPQPFVESCVFDLCVAGGHQPVLCQALNVYATQCQENGVQLPNWRSPGLCEIQCPANSHFESQGSGCPATCVNPNSTQTCPLPAQESCVCNAGYVLSGGVCVPLSECGCSFEGRYYRSGATVIPDEDCGRRCSCSHGSMTCRSHSCGPLESCRVEDGERGCRPNSYGTCWLKGSGSYHMFDGLTYHYPGACRLTLARVMGFSDHPHFLVTAEKVPRGQHDFARLLKFEALGTQVTINMADNSVVQVDGQLIRLPFRSASNQIQVYHSSIHSIILQTAFGVSVQTVSPDFVRITAPGIYNGSLGGLCGNFNGDSNDDFRTPNGMLVNSSLAFGDSWREGPINAQCVNPSPTSNYNSSRCDIIASPDSPFTQCWAVVDPQRHVNICREAIRFSGHSASALCEQLQGYALMCQQKGVTLEHWRNVTGCEQTCPLNSHYELCGSTCPFACPSLSAPFSCGTLCQEGCQCDDGFVLSGNQCVPPTSCGCYHEGHYRQAGEQFWDGDECQSFCSCNGTTGAVHCAPSSCGPQESCRVVRGEFGCHPNPHGTCSASGDPHYLTFDQKAYDFQGTCRYVLATLCNDTSGLPNFSVEAKNEPWFGLPVSVTAEVELLSKGLRADRVHLLNGKLYFHLLSNSLTCGLCGNFNGNQSDDFTTPSGAIVTAADEFGAAWKVANDDTCSDGCGSSCPRCTNEQPARAQCEVIKAVTGPFRLCHQHVDPTPYFNDCVFDTCLLGNERQEPLCRTIEAYISACHSANVEIFPWRDNTTCRLDCPANSHYELCGTDCGHTCASSIDATCERVCSEGCFCDEGFLRSGTTCVPVESCGCTYKGFYYNVGESFWKDGCSEECTCHSPNDLRCSSASCTPTRQCRIRNGQLGCFDSMSTCTVWGDPHYISFDGALAHFQGTCSYIITESMNHSINETQFRVVATNNHRGNNRVSFVSAVDVYLSKQTESMHIRLGPNRRVMVNGSEVTLPVTGNLAQLVKQGSHFVVDATHLIVQFDGRSTLLVRISQHCQNRVTGMCGNFNNDPADDKVLPNGTLAQNDNEFGHGWKSPTSQPG